MNKDFIKKIILTCGALTVSINTSFCSDYRLAEIMRDLNNTRVDLQRCMNGNDINQEKVSRFTHNYINTQDNAQYHTGYNTEYSKLLNIINESIYFFNTLLDNFNTLRAKQCKNTVMILDLRHSLKCRTPILLRPEPFSLKALNFQIEIKKLEADRDRKEKKELELKKIDELTEEENKKLTQLTNDIEEKELEIQKFQEDIQIMENKEKEIAKEYNEKMNELKSAPEFLRQTESIMQDIESKHNIKIMDELEQITKLEEELIGGFKKRMKDLHDEKTKKIEPLLGQIKECQDEYDQEFEKAKKVLDEQYNQKEKLESQKIDELTEELKEEMKPIRKALIKKIKENGL